MTFDCQSSRIALLIFCMFCYYLLFTFLCKNENNDKSVPGDRRGNDVLEPIGSCAMLNAMLNEPRCEKTDLRGFRPGPIHIGLYSHGR